MREKKQHLLTQDKHKATYNNIRIEYVTVNVYNQVISILPEIFRCLLLRFNTDYLKISGNIHIT